MGKTKKLVGATKKRKSTLERVARATGESKGRASEKAHRLLGKKRKTQEPKLAKSMTPAERREARAGFRQGEGRIKAMLDGPTKSQRAKTKKSKGRKR